MTREHIKASKRFKVLSRDNFTCQYCGKKPPEAKLEIDHINPISNGGDNRLENLLTSCFECNRGKGPKIIREKTEHELKIEVLTTCAIIHFKERNSPILPSLAKSMIADLVCLYKLSASEIMEAINSSATPQHFFEKYLARYYFNMFGG